MAGQIALTLLLLTSAGAAINGFVRLIHTNLGYDPHNTMSVGIPVHQNAHVSWEDRSTYFTQLLARISGHAGSGGGGNLDERDAALERLGTFLSKFSASLRASRNMLRANFVSPEYFSVLHIPLLQGRLWEQPEIVRGARLALSIRLWRSSIGRKATRSETSCGYPMLRPSLRSRRR